MPKRAQPPPIPRLFATPSHREKLQQYLLDYYKSSTFKTCEHQTVPLMDSPPLPHTGYHSNGKMKCTWITET